MITSEAPLLVLGSTGKVGRALRRVWSADVPVIWHSRSVRDGFEACDLLLEPERLCNLARGCAGILCLPGTTDARHLATDAEYADNSRFAQAAIVAAQSAGCPQVLLCSSAAVYGNAQTICTEDHGGISLSSYGQSKRHMEEVGAALGQASGVSVCSLRIGNLVGADAILGGWQEGFQLDTFQDGATPSRSYLSARVLADVIVDLLSVESLPKVLNVAQPMTVSMGDLLDAAGLAWDARPAPADAIQSVELSVDLLQRTLKRKLAAATAPALVRDWKSQSNCAEFAL